MEPIERLKCAGRPIPDEVWHPVGTSSVGQSGLPNIPGPVAQLFGELVDHILEYYGVYVLSQQVEEEPVTDVALADDGVDALLFHSPVSKPENKGPDVRAEHDDNPVHDDHTREEAKEQEPEPDKNIDFLVNYVERKDAQGVMLLYVAGSPKLVEGALRHPWEDIDHRVYPVLLVPVGEGHHFDAVSEKCPIKESVEQEHLT